MAARYALKKAAVQSISVIVILLAVGVFGEAQQRSLVPKVGFLSSTFPSAMAERVEAFQQVLHDRGYVKGKNIIIEYRYAEGKLDRLSEFAAELVRLNVKAIVTAGPRPTRAAKQATSTIPVVMAFDTDPVANGFVASLARPGRNITGLSILSPEISAKQVELLKEIVPGLSRLAILGTSNMPGNARTLEEVTVAANNFGLQVQYLDIIRSTDIEPAYQAARKMRAQALLVLASPITFAYQTHFVELEIKNQLPAMHNYREIVEKGGLMVYAASVTDMFRRAALYVDKILRGAMPANLPVERPRRAEFIINLKTAKQIGLTISPEMLQRADQVIE